MFQSRRQEVLLRQLDAHPASFRSTTSKAPVALVQYLKLRKTFVVGERDDMGAEGAHDFIPDVIRAVRGAINPKP